MSCLVFAFFCSSEIILFILGPGAIELLFDTYIKGRGSEGMPRRENTKFLTARNAVFLHSGGLLPSCITDPVAPRRQPKKSLFKNNLKNIYI